MDIRSSKNNILKISLFLLIFINIFIILIWVSFEDNSKDVYFKSIFARNDNEDKVNLNQNTILENKIANEKEEDMTNKNLIIYEQNLNSLFSEILPPNITFLYNNTEYFGNMISYKFREDYTFAELQEELRTFNLANVLIPLNIPTFGNLSNYITNNSITIKNGSELKFTIIGYPERLEPSSLSINSYKVSEDENILQNPKVLQITNNQNELNFSIDLSPGKYVMIATATWIPESRDHVGGYVMYGFNIDIKI